MEEPSHGTHPAPRGDPRRPGIPRRIRRRPRESARADGSPARGDAPAPPPRPPRRRRARPDRATPSRARRTPRLWTRRSAGVPRTARGSPRTGRRLRRRRRRDGAADGSDAGRAQERDRGCGGRRGTVGERVARAGGPFGVEPWPRPSPRRREPDLGLRPQLSRKGTTMRQVYDTPGGLEVALQLGAADIRVDVRDTATTTVEIDGYDAETPPTVRCEPAPGGGYRLTIEHRVKRKWFANGRELEIRLVVPPDTTIDGSGGATDLNANGTLAALSFRTGSGDLHFDDVHGDVHLTCASGDIEGRSVGGHLGFKGASGDIDVGTVGGGATVRSASGDIRIGRLDGPTIITVGSGDVTLRQVGAGSVNVRAISGDVEVGVRTGLGVWLDVSSTSGDVRSGLDAERNGGADAADLELTLNTVAGDIRVDRAGTR